MNRTPDRRGTYTARRIDEQRALLDGSAALVLPAPRRVEQAAEDEAGKRDPAHQEAPDRSLFDASAALLLLAFVVFAGFWHRVPGVIGAIEDDGVYVSTARALAEGSGYRLIHLPGEPLQTKYPPLFPLLLAAAWRLQPSFPANITLLQSVSILAAAFAAALSYLYLVRFSFVPRMVAAAGILLVASTHFLLHFVINPLSEMPFALTFVLMLIALERVLRRETNALGPHVLLSLTLAAAIMTRSAGIALVPPVLLLLLIRRRRWFATGVLTSLFIAPWTLYSLMSWSSFENDIVKSYYTDYFGYLQDSIPILGRIIFYNAVQSALFLSAHLFEGFARLSTEHGLIVLELLTLVVGALMWKTLLFPIRNLSSGAAVIAGYAAIVCAWPSDAPVRMIVPMLFVLVPLMIWATYRHLAEMRFGRLLTAGFVLFLLGGAATNLKVLNDYQTLQQASGYPYHYRNGTTVDVRDYRKLYAWLEENVEAGPVAIPFPAMLTLHTGLKAVPPFVGHPLRSSYADGSSYGTSEEIWELLTAYNAEYLAITPVPIDPTFEKAVALIETLKATDALETVYVGEDPRFSVFRINRQGEVPQQAAAPSGNREF